MPNATSYTPGPATAPDRQNSFGPSTLGADAAYAGPSSTIGSTLTSVSTLLTTRRLAEQPDLDRERRLVARLAAVALDRVEDRRLLTADVGAGAAHDRDVEARTRPEDVVAEVAAARASAIGVLERAAARGYSPRM